MSFHPTPAQPAAAGFLEAALNPNISKRIRAISRAAHVHESSWRTWKHNPAFLAWYRDAWQAPISLSSSVWTSGQSRAASCSWLLDKIGIQKARHDFRFWKVMQEKYSASPPGLPHRPLTVIIRAPRPLPKPQDKASGAPPKKREKNRARPNRARWIQTAAPCPMQDNIGARPEASG